jgi:hypothetical protein
LFALYKALVVALDKAGIQVKASKVRRSRVIGDYGGYRRLIVYFAVFGREGLARHGGC